eukprot:8603556-Heterocapsa_arctica.AAC.1
MGHRHISGDSMGIGGALGGSRRRNGHASAHNPTSTRRKKVGARHPAEHHGRAERAQQDQGTRRQAGRATGRGSAGGARTTTEG